MDDLIKFSWPLHTQQFCEGIIYFLKENIQTDFKLCVKNDDGKPTQVVKVHHLVLSIFCPALRNSDQKKLTLRNCKLEDVKNLVEFIYTGKTSIAEKDMINLRNCAQSLGLTVLVECMESYLGKETEEEQRQVESSETLTATIVGISSDQTGNSNSAGTTQVVPIELHEVAYENFENSEANSNDSPPSEDTEQPLTKILKNGRVVIPKGRYSVFKSTKASKKIKCKYCSYTAPQLHIIKTHMACSHHIDFDGNPLEKNVRCSQCSFTCYARPQLTQHRLLKHKEKRLKCQKCSYVCYRNACLRQHILWSHSDEKPYMCEICGMRFKSLGSYKEHLLSHTGQERKTCDICGQSVKIRSFKRHTKLHESNEKPFSCHLCSFATRQKFNLRMHLKKTHQVFMDSQGNIEEQVEQEQLELIEEMAVDERETETKYIILEPVDDNETCISIIEAVAE